MAAPKAKYWLMKAEPDSRIVKGKDVKFSVDDFESVKTTPWEGVRNHEAKNLMKEMKIGDNILFYHSNCKTPGIAGFAKVSKEAYPDYTAWDAAHPYYDPKSDQNAPKWYMIDATFSTRAAHFVPLSYLRTLAAYAGAEPPEAVEYIGAEGLQAIKGMALVNRGRLSVQRVEAEAWTALELMATRGGWEDDQAGSGKTAGSRAAGKKATAAATAVEGENSKTVDDASNKASDGPKTRRGRKQAVDDDTAARMPRAQANGDDDNVPAGERHIEYGNNGRKRKVADDGDDVNLEGVVAQRRSVRLRK